MCCQSLLYLRILNVLISDSNEYSLHKREATFTCSQGKDLAPWRSKMVFKSSTKPCREDSHFKPPSNPFRINCSFSYCQSLSGGQVGLCFAIQIAQKIGRQLFHVQKLLRIVRWVLLQRLSWLPCIFLQSELRKYKEKLQSQVTRNFPGRTWLLPLWPQVLALSSFVWEVRREVLEATESGIYTEIFACKKDLCSSHPYRSGLRFVCMHLSLCFPFHTMRIFDYVYILPLLRELFWLARCSKFHTKAPDLASLWLYSVQPAMRAAPS